MGPSHIGNYQSSQRCPQRLYENGAAGRGGRRSDVGGLLGSDTAVSEGSPPVHTTVTHSMPLEYVELRLYSGPAGAQTADPNPPSPSD